jgi:hypothetical protein
MGIRRIRCGTLVALLGVPTGLAVSQANPATVTAALVWRAERHELGVDLLAAATVSPSGTVAIRDPFTRTAIVLGSDGRRVGWLAPGEQLSSLPLLWMGDTLLYSLRGADHYRMAIVEGRRLHVLDDVVPLLNPTVANSPYSSLSIVHLMEDGRSAIVRAEIAKERRATDHADVAVVYWHGTTAEPLGRMMLSLPNLPCRGEIIVEGIVNPYCHRIAVVSQASGELRFHLADYDRWDVNNPTFRVVAMRQTGDTAFATEHRYVPQPTVPARGDAVAEAIAARFPSPPLESPTAQMIAGDDGEVWLLLRGERGEDQAHWLVLDAEGRAVRTVVLPRSTKVLSVTQKGEVMVVTSQGAIEKYRVNSR